MSPNGHSVAMLTIDSPILYGDRVETSKPYHLTYIDQYSILVESAEFNARFHAHGFDPGQ